MVNVAIMGVGLIGGSLGMALKAKTGNYHITGIGRNINKLKTAKKLKAVDEYTLDWQSGVKNADIVVICVPVNLIAGTVKMIAPYLKKNAIVTDAGSVKGSILAGLKNIRNINFVAAHPMAGLEKTGVMNAEKDLYKNASVVICSDSPASLQAKKEIIKMWGKTGANVVVMDSVLHDKIVSLTSHFPHILAFLLSASVAGLNKKDKRTASLLAGSFKDLTRIASSSPQDWAAICSGNSKELCKTIGAFIAELLKIRNKISSADKLEKVFVEAKQARQKLLNIKQ